MYLANLLEIFIKLFYGGKYSLSNLKLVMPDVMDRTSHFHNNAS